MIFFYLGGAVASLIIIVLAVATSLVNLEDLKQENRIYINMGYKRTIFVACCWLIGCLFTLAGFSTLALEALHQ